MWEWKSRHHNAGVENAGVENTAPQCRGLKRERSQYGKPHFDDFDYTRRALHERKFF